MVFELPLPLDLRLIPLAPTLTLLPPSRGVDGLALPLLLLLSTCAPPPKILLLSCRECRLAWSSRRGGDVDVDVSVLAEVPVPAGRSDTTTPLT